MQNVVWFISFKLADGASVGDFLAASKKVHDEVLSKQKGFISWNVLAHEDTWTDLVTWETMEDAVNGETAGQNNPVSHEFYAFLDPSSIESKVYTVEAKH